MKRIAIVARVGAILAQWAMAETDAEFLSRTGRHRPEIKPEEMHAVRVVNGVDVPVPPAERKRALLESFNDFAKDHARNGISYRAMNVETMVKLSFLIPDGTEKEVLARCFEADDFDNVREACAEGIGLLNHKDVSIRIKAAIRRERNVRVRLALAEALVNLEEKAAPEIPGELKDILERKGAEEWELGYIPESDSTLGKGGYGGPTREDMVEAMRGRAAKILARSSRRETKTILQGYLDDPNQTVRETAGKRNLHP